MDTLCRICIEHVTKCTSLSSKIEDSSNRSYFDFLNKCTTLNAHESDSLPQSLCSVCANAMKTFYSFMKLAEKSDLILREALRNLTAEGRYNGRREIPCGEVAITKKIEEGFEDFNQGVSFHCQSSKNSPYMLDIVKKESREYESTSIVDEKGAEINESEKLESDLDHPKGNIEELDDILFCINRHLTSSEHNDSEDDVPISLLKSRLAKNEDGADSQSNSLSEAYCIPSNVQSRIGKTEAKSKELVKEDPQSVHGAGGLIDNNGVSCEETTIRNEKIEEGSFHYQPRKNLAESSPYILDFVKEEPCLSESTSIVAVKDAEIDEGESNLNHPEKSIKESDDILLRIDRLLASIEIEHTDSEDDESISSLKRSLDKNGDETDCESTSCEEITERNETILLGCKICDKKFSRKSNLKAHLESHKGIRHKCVQCGMDFQSVYNLNRHMKWHDNPKPFKCENCGKLFRRKDRCIKHYDICKRRSNPQQLNMPVLNISVLKTPELKISETDCGICGKKFSRKDYLDIHMQNHMGNKPKCDICGKVFEHGSSLSKHMKLHSNPKRFNCEVCGKSLSSYYSRHREYCKRPGDSVEITKVECEICGKTYCRKETLDIHMELHKGVTRKCDQCGKEFKHRLSFTRHMRWHKNPRPFKCEYCGKTLARKPSYEKHKKLCKLADKEQQSNPQPIHTEPEKPTLLPGMKVACEICDKQFRKKSYLNLHMETHNGIIKKCDQCGKEFKTSLSLRSHMERHTNPQSFKCENCGEVFAWKCTYTRHVDICKGPRQPKDMFMDIGQKPIGNTIDLTLTTEDPNLYSRGNNDIIVEVT